MKRERVVFLSGPQEGIEVEIQGALTIGRSPENALQINDIQVSRKHAVIQQTSAGTVIRDLGSGNGTYVGSRRVLEYRLSAGDVIQIGPIELRFEAFEAEQKLGVAVDRTVRFDREAGTTVAADAAERVYETFFHAPREAATAQQLREAQSRLAAIYEANQIISSEQDLKKLFGRVLDQVFALIPAHNGVILLKDKATGELVTEYVKSGSPQGTVTISSTIVKRAFANGEAVITANAADDSRFDAGRSIIAQNISSAMCAPLTHKGETLGVVYVDTHGTTHAFQQRDLELLVALAGPAAIAIKNAQFVAMLEQAYRDTLIATANLIELRDHYTVGHTWRVTNVALEMARHLGWSDDELKRCEMGGVLHDVGKIAVDDAILRKPAKLTDEEYAKMKVHPERGARMMQDVALLAPLIPYALYHHERYDGKGYPYGLKGEDIPIEGRLLAVADTFDAMTSNRPYRKGMPAEVAVSEIERGRGTQFDPACVDALIASCREGRIDRVLQDYFKSSAKSVACPFCSTYISLPEKMQVGDEFECGVCHRRMRLQVQNEAYFSELLSTADVPLRKTLPPSPVAS